MTQLFAIPLSQLSSSVMHTRDPTAVFTPDLCSRVSFVNFTTTLSSLQGQCMNVMLKCAAPQSSVLLVLQHAREAS